MKWNSTGWTLWFLWNTVAHARTWEEQLDQAGSSTAVTDGRLSFKTDCHLLLWLHFSATSLNMRLLKHTHALERLRSQANIYSYWPTEKDTEHNTHTHTHSAHLCALLSPSPAVFANDALVFLSLNTLQNVTSKNCLLSSLFLFFKALIYSKTWASQVDRNKLNINSSSAYRKLNVFLKKTNGNAHIAQLSCTLVCLDPTALFWDSIRGFKPEYRTIRLRIADVKTVSFSFNSCFFLSSYPHVC